MADSITEELVRHHLAEMGYDRDALPEEALNQFVIELKQMYIQGEFENNDREFTTQKEKVTTNEHSQKILKKDYKGKQKEGESYGRAQCFDHMRQDYRGDSREDYREDSRDFSGLSEGELSSRGSSPVNYEPSRPNSQCQVKRPTKFKKCDPVNRFHELKSVWGKDKFLQRMENKQNTFTSIGYLLLT
jgi:hypothetical protein